MNQCLNLSVTKVTWMSAFINKMNWTISFVYFLRHLTHSNKPLPLLIHNNVSELTQFGDKFNKLFYRLFTISFSSQLWQKLVLFFTDKSNLSSSSHEFKFYGAVLVSADSVPISGYFVIIFENSFIVCV
jgi:hypothetical protein